MKTNLKPLLVTALCASRPRPVATPAARILPAVHLPASMRIPVTRENWACLRALRAAELAAWNAASPRTDFDP